MSEVRALAFGDLEAAVWGVAWMPDSAGYTPLAVGSLTGATVIETRLVGGDQDDPWRLQGESVELELEPAATTVASGAPGADSEGFDQLCTARGHFPHDGGQLTVDCLGWRARRGRLDLDRLGSFRQVSAWFAPAEGLALLALRPRKARGHDSDALSAAVLAPGAPGTAVDPRLSTTYAGSGLPTRAGMELWLDRGAATGGRPLDDGDGEEPGPHQYLRRVSGEALGARADWTVAGFELHAELFRWHNRGRDGAGVYLLGRRQ